MKNIKWLLKWGVRVYVMVAAVIGTLVIGRAVWVVVWNAAFAPAPLPVHLPNGFIYQPDYSARIGVQQLIADKEGKTIIASDVKNIMWHGNVIYGFRRGLAGEAYYYLCAYGDDCEATQHLNETDFKRALTQKKLPPYHYGWAKTYQDLLWEQSKTAISKTGG